MKVKELRDQNIDDLLARSKNLKKDIFELRQQKNATGKAEKPARFKTVKKEIARINTILNERKKLDGKQG